MAIETGFIFQPGTRGFLTLNDMYGKTMHFFPDAFVFSHIYITFAVELHKNH